MLIGFRTCFSDGSSAGSPKEACAAQSPPPLAPHPPHGGLPHGGMPHGGMPHGGMPHAPGKREPRAEPRRLSIGESATPVSWQAHEKT